MGSGERCRFGYGEGSAAVSDAALCALLHLGTFFSMCSRRLPERMVRCAEATANVQTFYEQIMSTCASCKSASRVRCADLGYQNVKFAVLKGPPRTCVILVSRKTTVIIGLTSGTVE